MSWDVFTKNSNSFKFELFLFNFFMLLLLHRTSKQSKNSGLHPDTSSLVSRSITIVDSTANQRKTSKLPWSPMKIIELASTVCRRGIVFAGFQTTNILLNCLSRKHLCFDCSYKNYLKTTKKQRNRILF